MDEGCCSILVSRFSEADSRKGLCQPKKDRRLGLMCVQSCETDTEIRYIYIYIVCVFSLCWDFFLKKSNVLTSNGFSQGFRHYTCQQVSL